MKSIVALWTLAGAAVLSFAAGVNAQPTEHLADAPQTGDEIPDIGHKEEVSDPRLPPPGRPPAGAVRSRSTWTRGPYTSIQVNVDEFGNDVPGDAANEPSMAVDPTNPGRIVIGWRQFDTVESNFRQAGWAYTPDAGQSWVFPDVLRPGEFASDPVLAADSQGNFYYYSLQPERGTAPWSCYLYKSFDGGLNWPQDVYARGGDKQWMVVDQTGGMGDGHVYMTWNRAFSCCGNNDFARSTNGGMSTTVRTLPTNLHWGTLSVGPDGDLYVCGESFWVVKSANAQDPLAVPTFTEPVFVNLGGNVRFSAGPNPGGLLGQAWIATDHSDGPTRGNVYLLSSVDPPGGDPLDVMFARSTDGGVNWSAPVRVNAVRTGWQWFGTMSVAPNGRIDVVWNDTRNDATATFSELYYSFSQNAGVSWSAAEPLSIAFNHFLGYPHQSKMGDYIHLISDNLGANLAYAATFNGEQDVYYLRIGPPDCNGNGVDDGEDITAGTSADCNSNQVPDECEPQEDCNANGVQDICDIAGGTSEDCTSNRTPDECEPDCNGNGAADSCDISGGTSEDCNANRVPDDCEVTVRDCNGNGIPDDCEAAVLDCNGNGVPDDCDAMIRDCNANGIPDDCDIAGGASTDCFSNGVPDECEPDCNGNGTADSCDLAGGLSQDCNGNGIPDECEIALQPDLDTNGNGILDPCDFQVCYDLWQGFQPDPPFAFQQPLSQIDYNDDGVFWENPVAPPTAVVFPFGCETGDVFDNGVQVLVDAALANPADGYVSTEPFPAVPGRPHCGGAIQSLAFRVRIDESIDSRIDWRLTLRDAVNGRAVAQLLLASTESDLVSPANRGYILINTGTVATPVYSNTGVQLELMTTSEGFEATPCYEIEVVLDNRVQTPAGQRVSIFVDGDLKLVTGRLESTGRRLDVLRAEPLEHAAGSGLLPPLMLDAFSYCLSGPSLMSWPDCNDNCIDDFWDIADGVALDCNANGVPDDCDMAQGTSTDCDGSGVPDECEPIYGADFDADFDVDLADYQVWHGCVTGPGGGPIGLACQDGDFDCDLDVDLKDFATVQLVFTGQ